MKSLVVFYSKSGNTEKVAMAIATGLGTQPRRIEDMPSQELPSYDLICVGTPVHGGAPDKKVMDFISQMPDMDGKKSAVFCTKSIAGDKATLAALSKALEAKGMVNLGSFSAVGLSRFFADFGPRIIHRGHPSPVELAKAEEFGRYLLVKMQ